MFSITIQGENLSELRYKFKEMSKELFDHEVIQTQTELPIEIPKTKKKKSKVEKHETVLSLEEAEALVEPSQDLTPSTVETAREESTTVNASVSSPIGESPIGDSPIGESPIGDSAALSVSKDAVTDKLQEVHKKLGLPQARALLQLFGANRVSELKEDQYAAFMDKATAALSIES